MAPSRRRRDSCPSHHEVGGFFVDFEAVRTASSDRDAPRRWGATNKQDQVRMEEERRRRLSLVKDEEAKEAHEREVRRQHRLIAVLEAEEARARAFYEYEFQNNLRERRDMKESEQEMRLFMLESKNTGGSKYDVGGATSKKSSKQERRDQLKKEQAQKLVRERECKEMSQEDDLAMSIRTEEKKQEQSEVHKNVL